MKTKKLRLCITCSGSGRIPCEVSNKTPEYVPKYEICVFCKGSGRVWELTETTYVPYNDPNVESIKER